MCTYCCGYSKKERICKNLLNYLGNVQLNYCISKHKFSFFYKIYLVYFFPKCVKINTNLEIYHLNNPFPIWKSSTWPHFSSEERGDWEGEGERNWCLHKFMIMKIHSPSSWVSSHRFNSLIQISIWPNYYMIICHIDFVSSKMHIHNTHGFINNYSTNCIINSLSGNI